MKVSTMYIDMLFKKYEKTQLSREELANELGISLSTIERIITSGNLPIRYKRIGNKQKARYVFPIVEVAFYLAFEDSAA